MGFLASVPGRMSAMGILTHVRVLTTHGPRRKVTSPRDRSNRSENYMDWPLGI
jgi:hypothetical protein